MRYLKSLFFNSLFVFFANHTLPGIQVVSQTKLPQFGGDLPFALALGFLNSLIYPALWLIGRNVSALRIAGAALVLNFGAYSFLKFASFVGIQIESVEGYMLASLAVAIGSFWTNFWEKVQHHHKPQQQGPEQTKSEPNP